MNAIEKRDSMKHDTSGTVIGSIIFFILAAIGLVGTITSIMHVYDLFATQFVEWQIIWSFFGLFMFAMFTYFTKELYQLIKHRKHAHS